MAKPPKRNQQKKQHHTNHKSATQTIPHGISRPQNVNSGTFKKKQGLKNFNTDEYHKQPPIVPKEPTNQNGHKMTNAFPTGKPNQTAAKTAPLNHRQGPPKLSTNNSNNKHKKPVWNPSTNIDKVANQNGHHKLPKKENPKPFPTGKTKANTPTAANTPHTTSAGKRSMAKQPTTANNQKTKANKISPKRKLPKSSQPAASQLKTQQPNGHAHGKSKKKGKPITPTPPKKVKLEETDKRVATQKQKPGLQTLLEHDGNNSDDALDWMGSSDSSFEYLDSEEEGEEEDSNSDGEEQEYEDDDDDSLGEEEEDFDLEWDSNSEEDDDDDDGSSFLFESDMEEVDLDEDYQLPEHVLEDLVIHQGTATKRPLLPSDNISFESDSNDQEAQIIEITHTHEERLKIVEQPAAYHRDELLKLSATCNGSLEVLSKPSKAGPSTAKSAKPSSIDDTNDCPELVPIGDEEEDNDSDAEEDTSNDDDDSDSLAGYSEVGTDDDSIASDINLKYIQDSDAESDMDEDEEGVVLAVSQGKHTAKQRKQMKMEARVIKVEERGNDPGATWTGWHEEPATTEGDNSEKTAAAACWEVEDGGKPIKVGQVISAAVMDYEVAENEDEADLEEEESNDEDMPTASEEEQETEEDSGAEEDEAEQTEEEEEDNETENEADDEISALEESTTKAASPPPPAAVSSRSSSPNIFCNANDTNHVLVVLKEPFFLYGSLRLTLLAGAAHIYGHNARIGVELEIFSPRGCAAVEISPTLTTAKKTTTITTAGQQHLQEQLRPWQNFFRRADLVQLQAAFEPTTDAVLLLRSNRERSKCVRFIASHMNERLFPQLRHRLPTATNSSASSLSERPLSASEHLLRCLIQPASDKALRLPAAWLELDRTLSAQAQRRVLIAGGKSVGKSTLLRFLINRQLDRSGSCLLIDLDIGQPELFVPQTVSCSLLSQPLLGPGFLQQQQPDRSYMVGHTNVLLCAHEYMRAVLKLLAYCHAQAAYVGVPWLINTMGYNKGFGMELMAVVCDWLRPSDVVQLQSQRPISNFDQALEPANLANWPRNIYVDEEFNRRRQGEGEEEENGGGDRQQVADMLLYNLHVVDAAVAQESRYQKEWDMSPKDLRYAMMLARLSAAMHGKADALTDCRPVCHALDRLRLVDFTGEAETRQEMLRSVEANLVYLCHSEDENDPKTTAEQKAPEPLICLGIGLVRAIDHGAQQLYLLPAMPHHRLQSVNCLAVGEMPLPTSLLINQGLRVKGRVPFVFDMPDASASKAVKQMPFRPAEFLGWKHKKRVGGTGGG